jgi:hypothetical protein
VDQTISGGVGEPVIEGSSKRRYNPLDSMVLGNRETRGREIAVKRRTVDHATIGIVALGLRVMIMAVRRSRAVRVVRYKPDLPAALPCRCNAGEKHQKRTSDEKQAFHDVRKSCLMADDFSREDFYWTGVEQIDQVWFISSSSSQRPGSETAGAETIS